MPKACYLAVPAGSPNTRRSECLFLNRSGDALVINSSFGDEVMVMPRPTDPTALDAHESAERFRELPERVRLEDTATTQPSQPPPDPTMGRNIKLDEALHAGG
jgi:hypothetical protein